MAEVSLLVTAGRGPAECRAAVGAVAAALRDEAESLGVRFAASVEPGEAARSCVVSLSGDGAPSLAASWEGTAAMVDPSARGRGGRRNFYVAVRRMPEPSAPPEIREEDVRFAAMRAGGPGGQHQNVTDSAVRAVHVPSGLAATARDGRSQHANRRLALERLRGLARSVAALREAEADRDGWLSRITVERGGPVRTLRP